eukprot:gnl/TRDRNA2_/TRDRNA2_165705_c0_seq3.p1 gnl/TRDRNA2_/TRDRNA2_165705_c0~~gnl/TRDRNA2_/TRDRNA2_165705_c0_seq3.p1  ORF type:complete len:241 (+),score=26.11 gnl/TRDRNA2_/TRDRNA2_165705_c0_seq3:175-897(+)
MNSLDKQPMHGCFAATVLLVSTVTTHSKFPLPATGVPPDENWRTPKKNSTNSTLPSELTHILTGMFPTPDGTRVYKFPGQGDRIITPTHPDFGKGKLYEGDTPPYFAPELWQEDSRKPIPGRKPLKHRLAKLVPSWQILEDGTNVHVYPDGKTYHILPDGAKFFVQTQHRLALLEEVLRKKFTNQPTIKNRLGPQGEELLRYKKMRTSSPQRPPSIETEDEDNETMKTEALCRDHEDDRT